MIPLRLQLDGYGIHVHVSNAHTNVHLPVSGSEEAKNDTLGVKRVSVRISPIVGNAPMVR